jgi:O-antigen/teichoic acid export membrane protein
VSFKKNILASYASQIYVTLIGIVMVPVYVRYMGAEAYGLVGFFAMLQAWFQLLDMGLTPTMARETARFQGGATDPLSLRRFLRVLEGIFIGLAVVGAGVLIACAPIIATRWLRVENLSLKDVEYVIQLIAISVALRLVSGLYRGAISGFERLAWLGSFNAGIATVRFVFVIPLFIYVGVSAEHFFIFQLFVALIELVILGLKTYRLMPDINITEKTFSTWDWEMLRRSLNFSLNIAFTSSVWIFVTQLDKLVLSSQLSLTDYAYFTLAVLVAGGVTIVSGPISSALMPRMARLVASCDEKNLIAVYRSATRLVAAIAIPTVLLLTLFAEEIVIAWTGDIVIARKVSPVLILYALGNGILVLAAFPYYLQYSHGNLRLHVLGNVLFLLFLIPSVIWFASQYGAVGAGYAWLSANIIYFVLWVPLVHMRFAPGLHFRWLAHDIVPIFIGVLVPALLIYWFVKWPVDRVPLIVCLSGVSAVFFIFSTLCWAGCRRLCPPGDFVNGSVSVKI